MLLDIDITFPTHQYALSNGDHPIIQTINHDKGEVLFELTHYALTPGIVMLWVSSYYLSCEGIELDQHYVRKQTIHILTLKAFSDNIEYAAFSQNICALCLCFLEEFYLS